MKKLPLYCCQLCENLRIFTTMTDAVCKFYSLWTILFPSERHHTTSTLMTSETAKIYCEEMPVTLQTAYVHSHTVHPNSFCMDHYSSIDASLAENSGSIPGRVNFLVDIFPGFSLNRKTNIRKFGPHSSPVITWPSYVIQTIYHPSTDDSIWLSLNNKQNITKAC